MGRHHRPIAVLFLDIDGFKAINDRHGHEVGDQSLRAVGDRLGSVLRPSDTLARIAGDEFAILLEDLVSPQAAVVPALVLAELEYWCGRRLPPDAWLTFLDDAIAGVYRVEPPTGIDLARCRDLQAGYADLAIGLVDASVVALAERLSEPEVVTLDQRHFRAVRPLYVEALELRP